MVSAFVYELAYVVNPPVWQTTQNTLYFSVFHSNNNNKKPDEGFFFNLKISFENNFFPLFLPLVPQL
jgi:hypothetical protein